MTRDHHRIEDQIAEYVTGRGQGSPPAGLMERILNDVRRTPRTRSPLTLRLGARAFAALGSFVIVALAAVLVVSIPLTQPPGIGASTSPSSMAGPTASSAAASSEAATGTPSPSVATTEPATPPAPSGTAGMTDPVPTLTPEPSGPVGEGRPIPASSWRLVADEPLRGEPGTIEAATNAEDFERIWADHLSELPVPRLGSDEFAVFFEMSPPFNCDSLELTGLALDTTNRVLYGVWSDLVGCSSEIAGLHLFVVIVERAAVPTGVLRLRLSQETQYQCPVPCEFVEEIEITL